MLLFKYKCLPKLSTVERNVFHHLNQSFRICSHRTISCCIAPPDSAISI